MTTYPIRFHRGERFVRLFFATGLALTILASLIIFAPRAMVKITTRSEPVVITAEVRLDATLSKPVSSLNALPARMTLPDEDSVFLTQFEDPVYGERAVLNTPVGVKIWRYRKADLTALAIREIHGILRQGWILAPNNEPRIIIEKTEPGPTPLSSQLIVRAEGVAIPQYPIEEWRRTAGYLPKDLQARIMRNPDIEQVEIIIMPSFWPFLPVVFNHLSFTLDILQSNNLE